MPKTVWSSLVSLLLILVIPAGLWAQGAAPTITPPDPMSGTDAVIWGGLGLIGQVLSGGWPPSDSKSHGPSPRNDGRSVDAILVALYSSVSHDRETAPDWKRMRDLFLPRGIVVYRESPQESHVTVLSVKAFQRQADEAIRAMKSSGQSSAVIEREIARRVSCFGSVCQILSTYESRHARSDPTPFARGVNSIQVVADGERWRIASIMWDTERPDNPIPLDYLSRPPLTTTPVGVPAEYLRKK
jgi:hypothetical protein